MNNLNILGYGNTGFKTRELYTRDGFGERYERYEACFPAPPIQPYIDEPPKLMAPRRKNYFDGYGNTGFETRELYTRDGFGERYERYEACFPAPPIQPYIDEPPKLMAPRWKNYFDEQCSDESSASSKEESYHNFSCSEDSDNDSDDTNNGSEEDSDSESEDSDNDSKHYKSSRKQHAGSEQTTTSRDGTTGVQRRMGCRSTY
ncbi:uncharacterized protein LOC128549092 [Mercenaria mercenaria]|uniref:uncharacterized protein LOC128549092 n=1 Tax=Mercenaria mercenaria TaxID=6596 RepID=UPI00234E3DAA|nr:uncharacterized protein LOC128549092 [Mercenaria mercenaria]